MPKIIEKTKLLKIVFNAPLFSRILRDSEENWENFRKLLRGKHLSKKLLSGDYVLEILNNDALAENLLRDETALDSLINLLKRPNIRNALLTNEFIATPITDVSSPKNLGGNLTMETLRDYSLFFEFWGKFKQEMPSKHLSNGNVLIALLEHKSEGGRLLELFQKLLCTGTTLRMRLGDMKFPDSRTAWVQLNEIFVNEDYLFEFEGDSPKILDVGTHIGLAIYFFKSIFPAARIIGFEPNPQVREIAEENIKNCGFENVSIMPYAISDTEQSVTFHIAQKDSMASSLLPRDRNGEKYEAIEVECRKLSAWLNEPVDFLKLDIEGEEDRVLNECRGKLRLVHHIFCEYHQGDGLAQKRFGEILGLLDSEGFEFHVSKSWGWHKMSHVRPFKFVERPYSAIIYARNKTWPPETE